MTTRIQDLALEAERYAHGKCGFVGHPEYLRICNAKFADLIVKDCLNVVNQPNGVGDDDVIRISNDIKKHFGIK